MSTPSVIVVGAGPVGLATALELGLRGQEVLVLEAGNGQVHHPRAGGVNSRTMEFVRRWGLSDQVRGCGFPADYPLDIVFSTGLDRHELYRHEVKPLGLMPTPPQTPERRQRCPQLWFDPILTEAASKLPNVDLRFNVTVDRLESHSDGVTAHFTDAAGQAGTVDARYAVACDGAASPLRSALGIEMSGIPLLNRSIGVFFRSKNLVERAGVRPSARWVFISPEGPIGNLTVVNGDDLWRFTHILEGTDRQELDVAGVERVMRRALGPEPDIEILDIAPWRRSQLVADSYRSGNIFLAGDSAHTMSPTGGHGSNTGIGDAVDLAWKLDARLRGWGGEDLLDSYELERRPIAQRNASAATRNFYGWYAKSDTSLIMEESDEAESVRRQVGQELFDGTREEWESIGVALGYRYENSPIVVGDDSPEPEDTFGTYTPTNRAGHRAPHAWIDETTSVLDWFGEGFMLLHQGSEAPPQLIDSARKLGVPLAAKKLPSSLTDLYPTELTLVRPDGHVAWRGDTGSVDERTLLLRVAGRTAEQEADGAGMGERL
ncbi:FAD-dependent oxidoreductase [Rhodococcus sp. NPDC127530]|uniref:FAD-dependent oxidoreductase n=1 Tax=unclassified Rhodococcus (in: high G+C Gram-positive bacteria) TaxID=192944 RepID=UPI0036324CA1